MAPQGPTRIAELAATIQLNTSKLDGYFAAVDIPSPSFEHGFPETLPPDIEATRDAISQATDELHDLMVGPRGLAEGMPLRVRNFFYPVLPRFDCVFLIKSVKVYCSNCAPGR